MSPGSLIASLHSISSHSASPLPFIFRAMPLPRWSQHQLIEVISQRQIHAVFPAVRLSFPTRARLRLLPPLGFPAACLLPAYHLLSSSYLESLFGSAACHTSYRADSRDLLLPMLSQDRPCAGRNKHHFRVPVIGRIRAQLPRGERAQVPLRE